MHLKTVCLKLVEEELTDIETSDQSLHLGEEDDIDQVGTQGPADSMQSQLPEVILFLGQGCAR